MGKLTAEQKLREYNRGQRTAREGRPRSEPSAYPFESNQHYDGRSEAYGQGYDDQFQRNLAQTNRKASDPSAIRRQRASGDVDIGAAILERPITALARPSASAESEPRGPWRFLR